MSAGFATARCAQPQRSDVAAFLASLEANALALRNPLTGRLTALDETGEQVDVAERELVDRLSVSTSSPTTGRDALRVGGEA